jgi:hypothetical protein
MDPCLRRGTHQVYIKGQTTHRLQNEDIVSHLVQLVEVNARAIEEERPSAPTALCR